MLNDFDFQAWPVAIGTVYADAVAYGDWDLCDAAKYELKQCLEAVAHLECCYELEAA